MDGGRDKGRWRLRGRWVKTESEKKERRREAEEVEEVEENGEGAEQRGSAADTKWAAGRMKTDERGM